MKRYDGDPSFAIWVVGDSNPKNWHKNLDVPLDRRHPTRHNILTSVLDGMQHDLFRRGRLRVDDRGLYIRNAVEDADHWSQKDQREREIEAFRLLLKQPTANPVIVLCFGERVYEFARVALGEEKRSFDWPVPRLAEEFHRRIEDFHPDAVNVIPLLHASVARVRFLQCHRDFSGGTGNYFRYVGETLARVLLDYPSHPRLQGVWMKGVEE